MDANTEVTADSLLALIARWKLALDQMERDCLELKRQGAVPGMLVDTVMTGLAALTDNMPGKTRTTH